jgi:hypothetical protein
VVRYVEQVNGPLLSESALGLGRGGGNIEDGTGKSQLRDGLEIDVLARALIVLDFSGGRL